MNNNNKNKCLVGNQGLSCFCVMLLDCGQPIFKPIIFAFVSLVSAYSLLIGAWTPKNCSINKKNIKRKNRTLTVIYTISDQYKVYEQNVEVSL